MGRFKNRGCSDAAAILTANLVQGRGDLGHGGVARGLHHLGEDTHDAERAQDAVPVLIVANWVEPRL